MSPPLFFSCIDVYQLLKDNLSQDDAVVGEAAGVGMGLVMLGTCSEMAIKDMIEVWLYLYTHIHVLVVFFVLYKLYSLSLSLLVCFRNTA